MRHSTFSHVPPCSGLRLTLKTFWPISHRCTAVERRRKTISWAMPKPFLEGHTIVEALDDSNDIVFYTHTLCPYAQRVWLTLLEKVIAWLALPAQTALPQVAQERPWSLRPVCLLYCRELIFNQSRLTLQTNRLFTELSRVWCLLSAIREASPLRA
jgi:hypothetical protein